MSLEDDSIDDANIDFALEEEYMSLIHKVVHSRVYHPAKIKKIDEDIAKLEMRSLKMKLRRKRITYEMEALDRKTEEVLDNLTKTNTLDPEILSTLSKELDDLEKIITQIRHDNVHKLTREAINSEAILDKIKKRRD